ncbi:MAG: DNA polymerase III subunit alpha [Deltaproteobacteria bacterium]|nr:DNA polymerase III subunit alpha [Deltaproteobacteria bacterium]
MTDQFVHLHLHSQYSLLDGAIRLDELCQRVTEYGMPAVAVTDHGNMFGAVEFYHTARKHGVKPILGVEAYVALGSRFEKPSGMGEAAHHLVLLVQDATGYRNLSRLITAGYLEGFHYRPRMDKALLAQHHEGLIALSGCLRGEVPYQIGQGEVERARAAAAEYRDIFGDRFYFEIQENGVAEQSPVNEGLLKLSREMGIPVVGTNDCHYLSRTDARAHDVLLCIQTGKSVNEPNRMRFASEELFVKPPAEMARLFAYAPDAARRTLEIAERCDLQLQFDQFLFPRFAVPEGETLESCLEREARGGLARRLQETRPRPDAERVHHYEQRLREELGIITTMGFAGYFLIVADFITYAKRKGIPVGPGRGSAAGSLVAYALGITELDPIAYNLLFERFLNPERISMPDIDIDFCMDRRDEVIQYVQEKYGKENVAQIITFGKMQARAVVRDVGRVLEFPYGDVDRIAKLIPETLNITLEEAIRQEPRLRELEERDPHVRKLLGFARALEGLTRHVSTHAAGVVISDRPLVEHVPLYSDQKGTVVTQFAKDEVEKIGLVKFDFLGLKTLTMMDHVLRMVQVGHGAELDLKALPLDDPETYRLLQSGNTTGVFQLESSGMRDLVTRLRPECFEDIIALLSLYRPGPLVSGMVDEFIRRKQGKVPIKYEVPELRELLEETYGVILYQEQVMRIASRLANFTMADADLLRRAMGKKKPEEMQQQKERFLVGAIKNGIDAAKAEKIFDQMAAFAGYGFNRSHSAAYALIAYQTAYLKAHYPLEFMAALLSTEKANTDKVIRHIADCREMGITVLPPDVNESHEDFTVVGGKIRFGLGAVKNVGGAAVEAIQAAREEGGPFASLPDFCARVDLRRVNRRVIESLIKCGAFDFTGAARAQLMTALGGAMEAAQRRQRGRLAPQQDLFGGAPRGRDWFEEGLPEIPEWPESQRLTFEKEALGFYITGHPLARVERLIRSFATADTARLGEFPDGTEVRLGGIVSALKEINTRKGGRMAFVTLEDLQGFVELIVFSDLYLNASPLLKGEEPILVRGVVDRGQVRGMGERGEGAGQETVKVIAREVLPLAEARARLASALHLRVQAPATSSLALTALRDCLGKAPGPVPVYLHVQLPGRSETVIALPPEYGVTPSDALLEGLRGLLGEPAIDVL